MYISALQIEGYKNSQKNSTVALNKGLNILVGENGSGKTAIINALRLILRENESYFDFSEDDFYCSLDKNEHSNEVKIVADFTDLSEDDKITFLTWCDADFNAHLHLLISENCSKRGHFKRKYWGGNSSASIFEEDTFDRVECIYLPPLRDAETKLANGKKSRLAMLLKKQYGNNTDSLVNSVKTFNDAITENEDGKYAEIEAVKKNVNTKIKESLGNELGQSINLQFTETTFSKIIENIKMVFFPKTGETNITKFRDLATNSLGYNNLLYIATVFAELELIKDSDVFTALLIEEPEAHLHPQLQVKFIKYLEVLADTLPNAQIIVSTHSPVLASSVNIDKIIHISEQETYIKTVSLKQKSFGDDISEKYINRWLDVTKSTMLFSRGIIMVEGIAEALIIPKLALNVLKQYNHKAETVGKPVLANSIEEMGISVININGINFKHFMKLFSNFDSSSGPNIPIYCAGLSDRDPDKNIYPLKGETVKGNNPVCEYLADINSNKYTRLFISPLKTFEYDMAMLNPAIMAKVLKSLWPTENGTVSGDLQKIIDKNNNYDDNFFDLREDAKYIYSHIDSTQVGKGLFAYALAEKINDVFIIPEYIQKAILWACGGIEDDV
jgi:predicted ATP-dependent endonuclease of OLD family